MNARRLLVWRLRLAVAASRGRGGRARGLELFVSAAVGVSLFFLAWVWTTALGDHPDAAGWLRLVPIAVLHVAFVLSLLRDTAAALGHLFLSPDVELLLASPLRPVALVALKGAEALADAASSPAAIALPVLLGYGLAVGAPPLYFFAAPALLLLLLWLTVGAGFLLALLLAPIVPAGRVRQWLRLAVGAFSVGAWLLLVWWNAAPGGGGWSVSGAPVAGLSAVRSIASLPSAWVGEALLALARRADPLPHLAPLAAAVALVALAVALVSRSFPLAWQRSQVLNRRVRRIRPPRRREIAQPMFGAAAHAARVSAGAGAGLALAPAFARRDAKLVGRDPNLLWDMGLLLVMSSVLPIAVAPMLSERPQWLALPALLFFAAELGYDLGSRAFPLERRAWPWVFAAPLSPGAILAARAGSAWAFGAALVALAGTAAWIALRLGQQTAAVALGAGGGLFTTTLAAGFAAGVYLGRADWRHPRQMLNLGGRLLLVATLLLLSAGLVLSLRAASDTGALGIDPRSAVAWGSATASVVIGVSVWAALRRLRRFEGLG